MVIKYVLPRCVGMNERGNITDLPAESDEQVTTLLEVDSRWHHF